MKLSSKGILSAFLLVITVLQALSQDPKRAKIRVGYNQFNMVIGEDRYKKLAEYLPQIMITQLLESPIIFIKDQKSSSFQIESQDTTLYDFWLSADFSISKEKFSMNAFVQNLSTKEFTYFDRYTCPLNGILNQVKVASAELDEFLKVSSTRQVKFKKLAILCFNSAGDESGLARNLSLGLTVNLKNPNISLLPWASVSEYCERNTALKTIMLELKVDALMSGDLKFTNGEVLILPWIFVAGRDHQVYLPEIVGLQDDYVKLEQSLLSDVDDFLNTVLQQGEWELDSLDFHSNDDLAYAKKGIEYFGNNELYSAAYMFSKALMLNPNSDTVITNLALVRQWQKRYAEAIKLLKQALLKNPDNTDALYSLGTSYYYSGNYRKAVDYLLEARKKNSVIEDLPWLIGRCYLLLGENKSAIKWYQVHLGAQPEDFAIRSELGEAYFNSNQYDIALECFNQVITQNADDSVARTFAGMIYTKKGTSCFSKKEYQDALNYFSKARSYIGNELIYNNLIFANNKLGKFRESDEIIVDGLKKLIFDSTNVYRMHAEYLFAEMQNASGKDYQNLGQASVKRFRQHLDLNPNDASALWLLGSTYISLDSIGSAINAMERSIAVDSSDARVFLDLGEAYILNSNAAAVRKLFAKFPSTVASSRDKIIMLYLRKVAAIMSSSTDQQANNEFAKLLDQDVKVSAWNFYVFERWLTRYKNESPDKAEEIKKLTNQIKQHSQI